MQTVVMQQEVLDKVRRLAQGGESAGGGGAVAGGTPSGVSDLAALQALVDLDLVSVPRCLLHLLFSANAMCRVAILMTCSWCDVC